MSVFLFGEIILGIWKSIKIFPFSSSTPTVYSPDYECFGFSHLSFILDIFPYEFMLFQHALSTHFFQEPAKNQGLLSLVQVKHPLL